MKKQSKSGGKTEGFTLVELIIGFSILLIIVVIVGSFSSNIFNSETFFQSSLSSQTETQQALQGIVSEIRSATPSSIGGYPIDIAATSTFGFYSDFDEDGIAEHIRYFLNGTTLQRGIIQPTGNPLTYNQANETVVDIIHNVILSSNPVFTYYDQTYTGTQPPLTQPVNISFITVIGIQVQASAQNQGISSSFNAVAVPRNLRTNL